MKYRYQLLTAFAVGAAIRYAYDATRKPPVIPRVTPAPRYDAYSKGGKAGAGYRKAGA